MFIKWLWETFDKPTIDKMLDFTVELNKDPAIKEQEEVSQIASEWLEDNKEALITLDKNGEVFTLDQLTSFDRLQNI